VRCSVLQRDAVWCSVLRIVAVCQVYCSVLQCVALCGSALQCAAACCSVAVCGSVLQCIAVCCSVLHVLQCVAVQYVAVCLNL